MNTGLHRSLERYVKYRIPTGGFLRAVLTNDLMCAIETADEDNLRDIREICMYITNNLPVACYGSEDAVKAWLAGRHKV